MSGLPGDFHFIRPLWLLLAPVAVALWWLWRREADPLRGWRRQLAPELLEALVVGHSRRQHWQGGSLLVAWLLAGGWLLAWVAVAVNWPDNGRVKVTT